jgi:hypothetical protein
MKESRLSHFLIAAPQEEAALIANLEGVVYTANNSAYASVFESFFSQVHDSLIGSFIALEIHASPHNVSLGFTTPTKSASAITSLLYSRLSKADIIESEDKLSAMIDSDSNISWAEASMLYPSLIPLPTYKDEKSGPLITLLNALQGITVGQSACIQLILTPIRDSLSTQIGSRLSRMHASGSAFLEPRFWFNKEKRQERAQLTLQKSKAPLFECALRIVVASNEGQSNAEELLVQVGSAFQAFRNPYLNKFTLRKGSGVPVRAKRRYNSRRFKLSSSEAACLFHFPDEWRVPSLLRVISHREPCPKVVTDVSPNEEVCLFGETNYRSQRLPFGLRRIDRRRHLYVLGKSGVGKSKLLELLIQNDINAGHGVGVLDPHGDLIDNVLRMIPEHRIKDVVLFDPADTEYPIGLNLLEQVNPELKLRVTISLIDIFKKLFGSNWSPRLEHVLRYTALALLDTPGTTLLSILQMLTDKKFRQQIVKGIKDDVVKNFWVNEFAGWSEKFDSEAITPLLNKVGQFVSTNLIRNIVGQPENKFDCRKIMDEKKILLVKISKGMLGEENASLIGSMIITKMYQAAMSRADIAENERKDFYFYVDEFQNFTTDTFDEILSEARKYRLNLTIANQFLGQLQQRIKTTVFGNVGSLICMRIGGNDSGELVQEFAPRFQERDLINLGVQEFVVKMSVNGQTVESFSGQTLPVSYPIHDYSNDCKQFSRQTYGTPLVKVEEQIGGKNSQQSSVIPSVSPPAEVSVNEREEQQSSDSEMIEPKSFDTSGQPTGVIDIGEFEFEEPLI